MGKREPGKVSATFSKFGAFSKPGAVHPGEKNPTGDPVGFLVWWAGVYCIPVS